MKVRERKDIEEVVADRSELTAAMKALGVAGFVPVHGAQGKFHHEGSGEVVQVNPDGHWTHLNAKNEAINAGADFKSLADAMTPQQHT